MQRTVYPPNSSISGPVKLAHKLKAGSVITIANLDAADIVVAHDRFTLMEPGCPSQAGTVPQQGGYPIVAGASQQFLDWVGDMWCCVSKKVPFATDDTRGMLIDVEVKYA